MKTSFAIAGLDASVLGLSKNGDGTHQVLRVQYEGNPIVLKCYGLKVTRLSAVLRQHGVRLLIGKSAYTAKRRCKTEREVLALWRREGFDVPELLAPAFLSKISQPCLAMAWIPGQTLAAVFRGNETPLERKQELLARFAQEMYKRHERALALREPRLMYEHPTFTHIIASGDRLVHYDFEITFTHKNNIDRLIRHEIAGFFSSLPRSNSEHFPELLNVLVSAYPGRERMAKTLTELKTFGTVPLLGWLEVFQKYFSFFSRYKKRAAETETLERLIRLTQGVKW